FERLQLEAVALMIHRHSLTRCQKRRSTSSAGSVLTSLVVGPTLRERIVVEQPNDRFLCRMRELSAAGRIGGFAVASDGALVFEGRLLFRGLPKPTRSRSSPILHASPTAHAARPCAAVPKLRAPAHHSRPIAHPPIWLPSSRASLLTAWLLPTLDNPALFPHLSTGPRVPLSAPALHSPTARLRALSAVRVSSSARCVLVHLLQSLVRINLPTSSPCAPLCLTSKRHARLRQCA
ncbi:Unknown protein, partial [Striga hermonthica]